MNNQKNRDMNTKKDFKNEQRKFEFTVYLNDNIIVQRFFNVIGYNQRSINSMNFKEVIDYNQELIQYHLKTKTLDFMNDNIRSFYENPSFEQNDIRDMIKIVVRMDGRVIAYREWDATIYPVKVRYTVDVREHIYEMITRIQKCLSEKNEKLETKYLEYDLAV
jgi:hypothetical protein